MNGRGRYRDRNNIFPSAAGLASVREKERERRADVIRFGKFRALLSSNQKEINRVRKNSARIMNPFHAAYHRAIYSTCIFKHGKKKGKKSKRSIEIAFRAHKELF